MKYKANLQRRMKSEKIPAEPCSDSDDDDEEPVITVPTFSNWYEYASLRLDNKIRRKYGGLQITTPKSCYTLCLSTMKLVVPVTLKNCLWILYQILIQAYRHCNILVCKQLSMQGFSNDYPESRWSCCRGIWFIDRALMLDVRLHTRPNFFSSFALQRNKTLHFNACYSAASPMLELYGRKFN